MRRVILHDARNQEHIFPYIGGEEVLNDPEQRHHRYVINFGEMREDEARRWPDLFAIVEEKVKPGRVIQSDRASREQWWLFARRGGALTKASEGLERLLVHPNLSGHLAFAFVPHNVIVGAPHNVFVFDKHWTFCVLQSRIHEAWARFFASSLKDDLRYTPSDCFETFPFPVRADSESSLEQAGCEYYNFRAQLMIANGEGLTHTYNRFCDPNEDNTEITKLREMHDAMDRVVLDAYGWTDIQPVCQFIPEFDDEEDEDENGRTRKKKYRYRWPDEIRDEVLARLLELNRQRAIEEGQVVTDETGPAAAGEKKPIRKPKLKKIAEVRIASEKKPTLPLEPAEEKEV